MIRKIIFAVTGSGSSANPMNDSPAERQQLVLSLTVGGALAQAVLIYLFLAAPTLRSGILVLAAAVAACWLLLPMLRQGSAPGPVRFLAVTNANFSALYGAYLFGDSGLIFLPWAVGAVVTGALFLRDWKRLAVSFGFALVAFAATRSLVPVSHQQLSFRFVANVSVLCTLAMIAYLSITFYARRILIEASLARAGAPVAELARSADAAEARDRDLSCFFAEASHAIRAPLDGIIGYSEMLTEEGAKLFDAQQLQDMGRIHQAGQQLLRMVSGVFDLSEIEASQAALSQSAEQLSDAATLR